MYGLNQDWMVVRVAPDYPAVAVRFADGTEHRFDLSHLFDRPGVFASLRDPGFFSQVGVVNGAVTWPDGTDLAPDAMYEEARRAVKSI